ncbi:hypothetical protein TSUD_241310 [Trifolium subterraneum]|uniref:Uncharacterized protein n=1 Tax=Trifolium subterraneum TaxID=3900 RepID=A0A2Z6P242_TRISU|nr:hypothetical protein TSUD_241310 [Trifolium subterraneum]
MGLGKSELYGFGFGDGKIRPRPAPLPCLGSSIDEREERENRFVRSLRVYHTSVGHYQSNG